MLLIKTQDLLNIVFHARVGYKSGMESVIIGLKKCKSVGVV